MYDLKSPKDLFTLLPQEMEVAEAHAMAFKWTEEAKKKKVLETIMGVAKESNIDIAEDLVSVFYDVINDASKGRYAINKEHHDKQS